ncbi:MAG: serine hydrolase domain-containing protein [Pseudomonadales bacterium]
MTRSLRMQQTAEKYVARSQFSSIEWQVNAGGEVLCQGATGFAAHETKTPLPDKPIYRIYSMTKPIVSVLALMLIEEGKLRLFDFLAQYNPIFSAMKVLEPSGRLVPAERPITVEDLLTHRAGFTYEFITGCHIAPGYDAIALSEDGGISLDDMMQKLASQPLAFQPGSQFRYSVATDVLAHVIEKASGERLSDLLRRSLFDPLDMKETGFHVSPSAESRVMPMYGVENIKDLSPINPPKGQTLSRIDVEAMYPSNNPDFTRGGHGLFSTTADYIKFATFLLSGKTVDGETLLSHTMLKMLQANRIPSDQLPLRIGLGTLPGYGWGLGVRVMMDTGQSMSLTNVGEFGWAGAASTYFWVDPSERMVGVIMTQYLGSILPMSEEMRVAAYQMLGA